MDVVVVGGGIIGLSCALELRAAGLRVSVVDRREPGHESSWAAAGILGPQSESHGPGPMLELCVESLRRYASWAPPDTGFRLCGTLHRALSSADAQRLERTGEWQRAAGLRAEQRGRDLWLPDEGQVDNRLLVRALHERAAAAGVRIERRDVRALGELRAGHLVLTAGCWSRDLLDVPVVPVRGQMLALACGPPPHVVFGAGGYLVPRGDRTLVGATVERAGFDRSVTAEGRAQLEQVAAALGVRGEVVDHWAGLRPGSPDGLPTLGVRDGVVVATGHFRNGILLAPITAAIVRALVLGERPPVDLRPFAPDRPLPDSPPRAINASQP